MNAFEAPLSIKPCSLAVYRVWLTALGAVSTWSVLVAALAPGTRILAATLLLLLLWWAFRRGHSHYLSQWHPRILTVFADGSLREHYEDGRCVDIPGRARAEQMPGLIALRGARRWHLVYIPGLGPDVRTRLRWRLDLPLRG